jgi:predicted dehydrogenase
LLAADDVEALSICSPNDAHESAIRVACARGDVAILCEKPLAATLQSATAIVELSRRATVGVNLPYRFHPLVAVMRERLVDRDCTVELIFRTPGRRIWRPVTPWYEDAARAGRGALLDIGIHALDILVALLGPPAAVVRCDLDDLAMDDRGVVELLFERATAAVQFDRHSRSIELRVRATVGGEVVELDVRRGTLAIDGHVVATSETAPETAAISGFLDVVSGRGGAIVEPADGLRLQQWVEAAYERAGQAA